jgi:hypothetical protein
LVPEKFSEKAERIISEVRKSFGKEEEDETGQPG